MPGCAGCAAGAKRIAELEDLVKEQSEAIESLKAQVAALQERLGQDSSNSHKPPSSDPPGTPKRDGKKKSGRSRGGQLGRKGSNRRLVCEEDVDDFVHHHPSECKGCGKALPAESQPNDPKPRRHQVTDLREEPSGVTEHVAHARTCTCGHVTRATIPPEIARSAFGPRLAAVVAYFIGECQMSRRQTQEAINDLFGIEISLGSIKNLEEEVSEALAEPVEEAAEVVRAAPVKNVDETGWKVSGWLWVAATPLLAVFAIGNRGKQGFQTLIGEKLLGVFTSDRWGVYSAVKTPHRAICWSHLIRDFKKLIARGGASAKIGREAKAIADDIFLLWKDFKAGDIDREELKHALRPSRRKLKEILQRGARQKHAKTATFCQNLLDLEPALWTFLRVEGVEPTNNHAERVLRKGVLWRKKCFGSPSDKGCLFVTRILTAVQSRRLQKKPVYAFLLDAVNAHRTCQRPPSLVTG